MAKLVNELFKICPFVGQIFRMLLEEIKICIIIVNYNGWDDTKECLDSILQCDCANVMIVVVDNASNTNRIDQFQYDFPQVHWLRTEENLGWSGGNNVGMHYAFSSRYQWNADVITPPRVQSDSRSADIVLLLNNDTVVHPDLFIQVRDAISKGYDIVGPVINEYINQSVIQTEGTAFNRKSDPGFFSSIPALKNEDSPPRIVDVDIVNGCAVAIAKRVFDTLGPIDDRFFLICEESDYCLCAKEAGFRCGVIGKSLVFHKHSVTFKKAGKPLQRYYASRNLWLLLKKHKRGAGRRSRIESILAYFRHMYHLICFELEQSNPKGAEAIVHGVSDALVGRYGKMQRRDTIVRRCALKFLESFWKFRGGRPLVVGEAND